MFDISTLLIFAENLSRGDSSIDFQKKLLEIAIQDLNSAKILLANKDYRNALYLLSQSIEKTTKAYFLCLGFIEINDLTDISHKSPKPFIDILKSNEIIDVIKTVSEIGNISVKIPNEENIASIEALISKDNQILARLTAEEIQKVINMIERFKAKIDVNELGISSEFMKPVMNIVYGSFYLYYFAFITLQYSYSRYPNSGIPAEEFIPEKLGSIEMAPQIIENIQFSIESLRNFHALKNNLINSLSD